MVPLDSYCCILSSSHPNRAWIEPFLCTLKYIVCARGPISRLNPVPVTSFPTTAQSGHARPYDTRALEAAYARLKRWQEVEEPQVKHQCRSVPMFCSGSSPCREVAVTYSCLLHTPCKHSLGQYDTPNSSMRRAGLGNHDPNSRAGR
jgi:hypothetical protein